MRKLMALLVVMTMVFAFAACGKDAEKTESTGSVESSAATESSSSVESTEESASKVEIENANEILTKVWDEYKKSAPEDVQFPIGGGYGDAMVMDAPGEFNVSLEGAKDMLLATFCINEEMLKKIDDIATMMNMMMANNFSCGAYHVTEAANVESVVTDLKDAIMNNQWMCGFPDKLLMVTVGEDYVVAAYGNSMAIDAFKTAFTTVYKDTAEFVVEANIAN